MCSCPCSTKRIDNSNSRLVSQVDKETGESQILEAWQNALSSPLQDK